jgi:tetratricopeptide (TPR) repeat protein
MRTSLLFFLLSFQVLAAPAVPSPVAKAAFERGEKALEASKFDEAVAAYQEALKATPNYAAALNSQGSALFKLNKKDEALASFKAATEADPSMKLAWFNLGYAARKTNDFAGAVVAYDKYVALDGNDPDGFYGLAASYQGLQQNEKAISYYEQYIAKEKRADQQKWVDKAKDAITQLKAAPVPAPAAVAAAPVAAATTPTAEPLTTLAARRIADGNKFLLEKNYREASFAFQDAVNAEPNNVEALFKLGNSYAVLGYYSQAIEKWQRVAQVSPDESVRKSANDNIARAQQKMAQVGGASPQEQGKAPGTGPVAETTRAQARQFYEQAVNLITQRRYSEALQNLNSCLQLEPALAVGYIARGSTLIGLSRFPEAAVDYQYALRLDPNLSAPLYGLAESYRGMNRVEDARAFYQRYVSSSSPDIRPELQGDARRKLDTLR